MIYLSLWYAQEAYRITKSCNGAFIPRLETMGILSREEVAGLDPRGYPASVFYYQLMDRPCAAIGRGLPGRHW